jgi:hypothetical protein
MRLALGPMCRSAFLARMPSFSSGAVNYDLSRFDICQVRSQLNARSLDGERVTIGIDE